MCFQKQVFLVKILLLFDIKLQTLFQFPQEPKVHTRTFVFYDLVIRNKTENTYKVTPNNKITDLNQP